MVSYIVLGKFTLQGMRNIQATTQRARDFKSQTDKVGIKVKDIYWTMGDYDVVIIAESPDDESMAAMLFAFGRLGNILTQTLRAFPMDRMETILGKMSEVKS